MSIEQLISDNTKALVDLTAAINGLITEQYSAPKKATNPGQQALIDKVGEIKEEAEKRKIEKAKPAPKVEEPAPVVEAEQSDIPYDTVRDLVNKLVSNKAIGKTKVLAVLKEFGVQKSAQELKPENYAEVLEKLQALEAPQADDEDGDLA